MGSEYRISARLMTVYDELYARHGPQHWWPADEPFEVIVGAILTQSTAWVNVERAIGNLKRAGALSPTGIRELPVDQLAELVRPSGYFNQKAKKLAAFVNHLFDKHDGDLSLLFSRDIVPLREELLTIYGIGPETADSVILYAAEKPSFVVDAYTKRLFVRLGLALADAGYHSLQRLFMDHLPPDVRLFNEYHALIVRHGKHVCRKRPFCGGCILGQTCPYVTQNSSRDAETSAGCAGASKCA